MKHIIQQYLEALESGDVQKIILLFSEEAIIHSPLYGDVQAKDFFKELFADTNQSKIILLNIFNSADKPDLYAAHFRYHWILKNDTETSFECVDIFQFDEKDKIREVSIIYDTNKIREGFESLD